LDYKNAYTDCNVPDGWPNNPKLAKWVQKQRGFYRNNKLSQQRFKHLDEIGFNWEPLDETWEIMFAELIEFKKFHGHCNVPSRWTKNHKLGHWVAFQRHLKKRGKLAEERFVRLEKLGLTFSILKINRKNRF
jgi:hypothetical protein